MKMGSGPECESMCHNILRIDPANDEATLMLADFLHRKSDQDGAINLFRDILEARSNNYVALVSFCRGKSFVVVVRLRFEAPVESLQCGCSLVRPFPAGQLGACGSTCGTA